MVFVEHPLASPGSAYYIYIYVLICMYERAMSSNSARKINLLCLVSTMSVVYKGKGTIVCSLHVTIVCSIYFAVCVVPSAVCSTKCVVCSLCCVKCIVNY